MELTLDQALQKGVEAHKAGKVQEADRYYTAILKAQPKHSDANHNMGVLAVGVGKVQEALPFFKTALEVNPKIAQYWLSYIDALIRLDRMSDAKAVFDQAKSTGAKGDGFATLEQRLMTLSKKERPQDPPKEQVQPLIDLYTQGKLKETLEAVSLLLQDFPRSVTLYNINGVANKGLGKLEEAIEAYKQALSLKPDYAEGYNNLGNVFQKQDKLEEAIEAYQKALSIKPDYAEAYYNLGVIFQKQGKLEEAIEAYNKATSIKSDYAQAYFNLGNTYQDQGKLKEAIEAYNKVLSIEPEFAEAHRNLSSITKYTSENSHFKQVMDFYNSKDLSEDARCSLSFTLAKMYEDIGKLDQAFKFLSRGNALRKKLLNYSIDEDKELFIRLKRTQPHLLKTSLDVKASTIETTPIFILGMPRSGTTLVEQIISSHSEVTGAGELNYVVQFGEKLFGYHTSINTVEVSEFRNKYLSKLFKESNGKQFITDKMPQNFRFIPLICAAFPEAKIIHIERDPRATCWSNFKQYFAQKGLGYSYNLKDVVSYYELYTDLMKLWQSEYGDRIYNLNYETLIEDQDNETRKLIKHLGLTWEDACLSPHKNKRSVRTASQQQVRKKIYKGSSDAWRKYETYLNGAFDGLTS